jgi:hypothetical protein
MDYKNPRQGLTSAQKTGFVLLLIFGILAVGMGVLQMRNNIFGPFVLHIDKTNLDEASLFMDENARLQSIDTDHDGLNDYEEIYFYETSAYLPDTDSDGLDDKTEISQGKNPFCPEGEACESADAILVTSTVTFDIVKTADGVKPADFLSTISPASGQVDLQAEIKKWTQNPEKLRETLLATGSITKEDLAKIDDATLIKLLQDTVIEKGGVDYLAGANSSSTANQQ